MLTIHGVPLSVHTRKIIVTAILKKMDYRIEAVIPVIPDNPPANWSSLSPTGLIPVLQDGDYTLADSNAICLYLEKKQPAPPILPGDARAYGRALWFDAYAGGTIFRHVVHPLFVQTVVNPNINKVPGDKAVIDNVLDKVQPKILGYLDGADRREVPRRRHADPRRYRDRVELHRLSVHGLQDRRGELSQACKVPEGDCGDRRLPQGARRREAVRRQHGARSPLPGRLSGHRTLRTGASRRAHDS